jgi:threonine/homoserine/homoserine lactone efflux protein
MAQVMMASLLTSPAFLGFLLASLVLAITPGPGVIYIVTRTLHQGRRAGMASVCGVAVGNLGNAAAASVGLAAVLKTSAAAFVLIKFAGAAYLIFLGIQALRAPPRRIQHAEAGVAVAPAPLFRDGFIVAILNPKTALFFAALLPQFMVPGSPPLTQSLVLSCVFVSIAACTDTLYVVTASTVSARIRRRSGQAYGRAISAATFFALGIYAALAGSRAGK